MDWDWKWLVDFNAGEIQLVSFDSSIHLMVATDVKMAGSIVDEKSFFNLLGLSFCSELDLGLLHCLYC